MPFIQRVLICPVEIVMDDGMAQMGGMDPDLVSPAGISSCVSPSKSISLIVSYSSTVILMELAAFVGESRGPKRLLSGKQQTFLHFLGLAITNPPLVLRICNRSIIT